MTSRTMLVLSAGAVLLLAGCRKTEPYQTPSTPRPEAYKEALPDAFKEAPGDQAGKAWKPSAPADSVAKGKWWEVFHDPALNALEDGVDVSNQSLKSAEARFCQARADSRDPFGAAAPHHWRGVCFSRPPLPKPGCSAAAGDPGWRAFRSAGTAARHRCGGAPRG